MSSLKNDRGSTRSLTPSLAGIKLLGHFVLRRSESTINKILKRSVPVTSASLPHAKELPHELLERVVAHIILDTSTLKACSLTCRSWYIASLPHLHHTLTLRDEPPDWAHAKLRPLKKLDKMQLLPFVKRLRILQDCAISQQPTAYHTFPWFLSRDAQSLVHFSAFTNIQELGVDELNLSEFAPRAQLCFGSFAPNLRLLALRLPCGSSQQLLCFLGLFPKVDDLKLIQYDSMGSLPDPALVPQLAPSLQGRLTLKQSTAELFLRDLSELIGGLRFRHLDLEGVEDRTVRFLMKTCALTLETFRVPPVCIPKTFDLCDNKSLRSLETKVTGLKNTTSRSHFTHLVSTITSPVFSEVVLVLEDQDVCNENFFHLTLAKYLPSLFRIKPFRLIFCLEIWDGDREETVRKLKGYIDAEEARGGMRFLPRPSLIACDTRARRGPRTLQFLDRVAWLNEKRHPHAL